MRKIFPLALAAVLLGAGSLLAGGEGWTNDFEAAKATAKKDNKDLFLDFTGSDFCALCILMNEEIFSKDVFKNVVPNDFVLVELDFPKDETKLPPEIRARNEKLAKEYDIHGFPTMLLADPSGRPYAEAEFPEDGAEAFVAHLATLRETRTARDTAFAQAAGAEGLDKAKKLHEGLARIHPDLQLRFYKDEIETILKIDTGDTLGYAKKIKDAAAIKAFNAKVEELKPRLEEALKAKDFATADKLIDGMIADNNYAGEMKQRALTIRLDFAGMRGDHEGAMKLFEEIVAVDPESDTTKELRTEVLPRIQAGIDAAKAREK